LASLEALSHDRDYCLREILKMKRQRNPTKFLALVTFLGLILAAIIGGIFLLISKRMPDPIPGPYSTARLEGTVMDRSGKVLTDLSVGVRNGPETPVDSQGKFVLNNVPADDQLIVVKSSRGVGGEVSQAVRLETGKTTRTNIVYDVALSKLGLLSITVPVDGNALDVPLGKNGGLLTVYGRCDGLAQIFDSYDVWILVKPQGYAPFFVQHPAAVIDPSINTWRADIALGDAMNLPKDGDQWTLVAVAARSDSGISHFASTPNLNQMPQHITSNVVTFTSTGKISKP
jgi:hypothetical protein